MTAQWRTTATVFPPMRGAANGRTLTGQSHDYTRHGTTTLFAALNVATGEVRAGHYGRRRRVEFLDFMNKIVADHPDRDIHVVLDNLNTHKPKRDGPRHPNVRFHFTPTHASSMNRSSDPQPLRPPRRQLHLAPTGPRSHRCFRRTLQYPRQSVLLDRCNRRSETPRHQCHPSLIPGTSATVEKNSPAMRRAPSDKPASGSSDRISRTTGPSKLASSSDSPIAAKSIAPIRSGHGAKDRAGCLKGGLMPSRSRSAATPAAGSSPIAKAFATS